MKMLDVIEHMSEMMDEVWIAVSSTQLRDRHASPDPVLLVLEGFYGGLFAGEKDDVLLVECPVEYTEDESEAEALFWPNDRLGSLFSEADETAENVVWIEYLHGRNQLRRLISRRSMECPGASPILYKDGGTPWTTGRRAGCWSGTIRRKVIEA